LVELFFDELLLLLELVLFLPEVLAVEV